jgi:hypothetical protein
MTVHYSPDDAAMGVLSPLLGVTVKLQVIGVGSDAGTQAAVVGAFPDAASCPLPYLSRNVVPHVTISTAPQSQPSESNPMLEREWAPVEAARQLELSGRLAVRLSLEQVRDRHLHILPAHVHTPAPFGLSLLSSLLHLLSGVYLALAHCV